MRSILKSFLKVKNLFCIYNQICHEKSFLSIQAAVKPAIIFPVYISSMHCTFYFRKLHYDRIIAIVKVEVVSHSRRGELEYW